MTEPQNERPAPVELVQYALLSATDDRDGLHEALKAAGLLDRPLVVIGAMLELTRFLAAYHGAVMLATPGGGDVDDGDRALYAFADAVWAEEPRRAITIWHEHLEPLPHVERLRWVSQAFGYASAALLDGYRGTTPHRPAPTDD